MMPRLLLGPRRARALVLRLALAGAAAFTVATTVSDAPASISLAVHFDELVVRSRAAAVIVPVEQRAQWEGRYIITYTKVQVDEAIAGEVSKGREVWIVTRGGVIGDIGQHVDGEPVFHVGTPALAFLRHDVIGGKPVESSGLYIVTGRAQGLFPIATRPRDQRRVLNMSPAPGLLLPRNNTLPLAPKPLAREVLEDKPVEEARFLIEKAWQRLHPKK